VPQVAPPPSAVPSVPHGHRAPADGRPKDAIFTERGSNVFNSVDPGHSTGSIVFLGAVDSVSECREACIQEGDCQSFVYNSPSLFDFAIPTKPSPYRRLCYGRLDSTWAPKRQKGVYSELMPGVMKQQSAGYRDLAKLHYR
jgi:hypothetical protein